MKELLDTSAAGPYELIRRFGHRRLRITTAVSIPPGQRAVQLHTSPAIYCYLPQPLQAWQQVDPSQPVVISGREPRIQGNFLALTDCRFEH